MEEQKEQNCEGCGNPTQDKDLTNVLAGAPLDIYAVCPECLARLEDEA
jgi:hypothetical protein